MRSVTVWWKDKERGFTHFDDIREVEYRTSNPTILAFMKENNDGNYVFINANEILYIEEETE